MLDFKTMLLQQGADAVLADKTARGIDAFVKIAASGEFPLLDGLTVDRGQLAQAFSDCTGINTTGVYFVTGAIVHKEPLWFKKNNMSRTGLFSKKLTAARKLISQKNLDLIENGLWAPVFSGLDDAVDATLARESRVQNGKEEILGPEDSSGAYFCQHNLTDSMRLACYHALSGDENMLEKQLKLLRFQSEVLFLGMQNTRSTEPILLAVSA